MEGAKERTPLKDKLNMVYYAFAIVGALVSGFIWLDDRFGIFAKKQDEQNTAVNQRIDKVENEVGTVKSDVKDANKKLDILIEDTAKANVYSKTTVYPTVSNGKVQRVKTYEVSNNPIPDDKKQPVAMPVEVAQVEEEDLFATSEKYSKKEELKKEAVKKKNIKYVSAVFYGDQEIEDNSTVSFRFPDDVSIGDRRFSRNTTFRGVAKKKGGKFYFEISDIENEFVDCKVYDAYKIEGINSADVFKDNQKVLLGYNY